MSIVPEQPCAHAACGCKVQEQGQFCSDACREQQGSSAGDECNCGHSDCVVKRARERADQEGH